MHSVTLAAPAGKNLWDKACDTVAWGWNVVWEKGNLLLEAITHLFFRVVGFFSESLALKLEAFWGHVTTMWERIKASFREKKYLETIARLEDENRQLQARVTDLAGHSGILEVASSHALKAKDSIVLHTRKLTAKLKESYVNAVDYKRQIRELMAQNRLLARSSAHCMALTEKNKALSQECQRLKLKCVSSDAVIAQMEIQAGHLGREGELADQFTKIEQLYRNERTPGDRCNTENELETLIPLFEQQRQSYCKDLQSLCENLGEQDPIRIVLKGLIRISGEQGKHVQAISQALHLHRQLRTSLTNLLQIGGE